MDSGKNAIVLEGICFHLVQALRLFETLDLSGFDTLEQNKWNDLIQTCKNTLESGKNSVYKLNSLLV
jgi:hypothetical protein